MAPQPSASVALLRSLTFRITSTPTKQLPSATPQITGAIWNCRDLLSTPTEAKQNSETSVVIHRFKTQLTSLLQDRSIEGRWAAVVLVKSVIEAGGVEVLSKCNGWVKSLLGILKKPDPPTTRILVVLTLARIFMLTWDYSNLVREITTPALTAFVPTCLSNIENKRCSARELETVLEAFNVLLPRHPTIFRTNESKLRAYLSNILSSSPGSIEGVIHYSENCRGIASRLLVQLHTCAPKQGASDKWTETINAATTAAHATCDRIFRAVDEDWESVSGVQAPASAQVSGDVELEGEDAAGLKSWKGVYAGSERLISLLDLIRSHLLTTTSATVSVCIGAITDLLTRLFAITLPHQSNHSSMRINSQVSKDEREALFAALPSIHVAAMGLCNAMMERFGSEMVGSVQLLVEHITRTFKAERSIHEIRLATYRVLRSAIAIIGPSMSKTDVAEMSRVLDSCCEEIMPSDASPTAVTQNGGGIKQQLGMAGSKTIQSHPADDSKIRQAAIDLVCTALDRLDATCLSPKLRAQIDRVAVLSRNERLLFASVLNPHRKPNDTRVQPSLLPILAREFGSHPQVEALLRPRMPPIVQRKGSRQLEEEEEEEEVDEEIADEDNAEEHDGFETANESPSEPFSTGPAQPGANSDLVEPQSGKRPATEEAEATTSAKRLRASPVAESLLPDSASMLPGPDPATAKADVPSTVALQAPTPEIVTAFQSNAQHLNNSNTATGAAEDGSDDSDVEMAPLTMEPDTDPEDEEDDE